MALHMFVPSCGTVVILHPTASCRGKSVYRHVLEQGVAEDHLVSDHAAHNKMIVSCSGGEDILRP